MRILSGLLLYLLSITFSFAQNCQNPISLDQFKSVLTETQLAYFPELSTTKIIVSTFDSDAYFLQAQPDMKTILKKTGKRNYEIQLNLRLLACPPEISSLQAILVHELEHVKDYESWTSIKIVAHALKYISNKKFRTQYERATDLKTLEKGLSHGLIGYRLWVYQWLTPKELQIKQRYYFTPQEIIDWEVGQQKEVAQMITEPAISLKTCSWAGNTTTSIFTSCIDSNFSKIERAANLVLPTCFNIGDTYSISYQICVRKNFRQISEGINLKLDTCPTITEELNSFYISCVQKNFKAIGRALP